MKSALIALLATLSQIAYSSQAPGDIPALPDDGQVRAQSSPPTNPAPVNAESPDAIEDRLLKRLKAAEENLKALTQQEQKLAAGYETAREDLEIDRELFARADSVLRGGSLSDEERKVIIKKREEIAADIHRDMQAQGAAHRALALLQRALRNAQRELDTVNLLLDTDK